jgi:hypothetical protein
MQYKFGKKNERWMREQQCTPAGITTTPCRWMREQQGSRVYSVYIHTYDI